ncbi:MAG: mannose-1-phosphate guanylyltransferase [Candidatus Margulisiibacteriota bacterium]|jgi:mannose-1-phosphate guanylyltransferase
MIHAIIMAGGKGTRFWPFSRALKPKQFLEIIGEKSLLRYTLERLNQFVAPENTWIVGNYEQKEQLLLNQKSVPIDQILYEPFGKNTAPCIGWAALEILKKDPDAIMVILPSDHFIKDQTGFVNTIKIAVEFVQEKNCLVTIGIKPKFPHTGYGYIEVESSSDKVCKVTNFKEKPDLEIAKEYIAAGNYYWNSGIFVWHAKKILELIQNWLPDLAMSLENIALLDSKNQSYQQELAVEYEKIQGISIDYGILERSVAETFLVPADFDWNDIGSWGALEEFLDRDDKKNRFSHEVVALDSSNNLVFSKKRLVALIDVEDLIVIDTEDALLVLPKKSDQKIKELYEKLPGNYQ